MEQTEPNLWKLMWYRREPRQRVIRRIWLSVLVTALLAPVMIYLGLRDERFTLLAWIALSFLAVGWVLRFRELHNAE